MKEFDAAKHAAAPETVPAEQPQMSEVSTVTNIFFEPGETFLDLKRKPRIVLATIIVALFISAYNSALYYKVGDEGVRQSVAAQFDKTPRASSMPAEQRQNAIALQANIEKYSLIAFPILIAIQIAIGGLFYWLGAKAFGGTGTFLHGWAVWVYSWLPPIALGMIANLIVLTFKSADDIDFYASRRGVIQASPGFFIDGKESPVLATLVGTLDLFMIWGWILAAIGLRITNRISSGSAWAIVIIFALVGLTSRVIGALFTGNPT